MTTDRLIEALGQKEQHAMEQLQQMYTPLIRYIISPILSEEADREECLSDVLMRAWDSIGSYDAKKAAFTTWLATLARNTALNHRRNNEKHEGHGDLNPSIPDPGDTPEQAVLRMERSLAVRRAVSELRPRDRELFYRKYYYYQSTAQIAAELGMTARGVEGKLYRIRKQLQAKLGGVWHE